MGLRLSPRYRTTPHGTIYHAEGEMDRARCSVHQPVSEATETDGRQQDVDPSADCAIDLARVRPNIEQVYAYESSMRAHLFPTAATTNLFQRNQYHPREGIQLLSESPAPSPSPGGHLDPRPFVLGPGGPGCRGGGRGQWAPCLTVRRGGGASPSSRSAKVK